MNRSKRRRQRPRPTGTQPAPRRGVLLLVVLSMLVLFLLIGTTFLITSGQYRTQMKVADQAVRSTFQPADLLERALMQLVRDTNNANSVIRHHSLLRDLYGVDGFVGRITMNGPDGTLSVTRDGSLGYINYGSVTNEPIMPRYAGFNPAAAVGPNNPVLGTTQGQIIEFYVADVAVGANGAAGRLSDHNAVGLDFDANGTPVEHPMSAVDGYYDGSLLTMLEGPCAGQTVRVVSYDHVYSNEAVEGGGTTKIVVSRWRVMAPKRADGQSLKLGILPGATTAVGLTDFVDGTDLGYRFMVNGRPFNGAGVGFNPLALSHDFLSGAIPMPRLSALERFDTAAGVHGLERALIPNAAQFVLERSAFLNPSAGTDPWGLAAGFYTNASFPPLTRGYVEPTDPLYDPLLSPLYQSFAGPGDTDESYDAPDTQNMALASQSLQPRLRGRVVNAAGVSLDPDAYYQSTATAPSQPAPAYLDLEGVTIPSFHRPALANFWFHRLLNSQWLSSLAAPDRVRAILSPYDRDGTPRIGLDAAQAAQIAAIKRKFMLRPLREDHPDFDGSNPLSRYGTAAIEAALAGGNLINTRNTPVTSDDEITFPVWEAVGPWDVDNDADGVPDSVWVDVGLPVQQTEDGRLYKPLVAMLVEDLDGRLNLNVHGTSQDVVGNSTLADPFATSLLDGSTGTPGSNGRNLAQDYFNNRPLQSSNQLPEGNGWGVAEVSLRSILSPTLPVDDQRNLTPFDFQASPQYDDYARLLSGRPDPATAGRNVVDALKGTVTFGRYGTSLITGLETTDRNGNQLPVLLTAPGRTHVANTPTVPIAATRDPRTALEFLGYPEYLGQLEQPSGFSTMPDLSNRYSNGLSAAGGAINEANSDRILSDPTFLNRIVSVTHDSPYELDVSSAARRLAPVSADAVRISYDADSDNLVDAVPSPLNDDAPFSPAELERLLRAFDGDADKLPDRLWEIVDSFDPDKLAAQQLINNAIRVGTPNPVDSPAAATSRQNVSAAIDAAVNRRAVTTDSFDLPVPNENWGSRLALGADGLPGVPQFNDDNPTGAAGGDQLIDEGDEAVVGYNAGEMHTFSDGSMVSYTDLFNTDCDDYVVVMREDPPTSPRITDFLRYRITLELLRKQVIDKNDLFTPATRPATLRVVQQHINNILVGVNNRPASRVATSDLGTQPALYSYGGLLAPELMAGLRMNLNRPFGDGRDNNDNGVVDEPQEAGEPFVDQNGNGVWDGNPARTTGEPFLDQNKNGSHDESLDRLWVDANNDGVRDPAELRPFSYTRGTDANGRGMFLDDNANGRHDPGEALIQDDGRTARQLYARHLYCLMLALTDENYLAPYDSNDPQVVHYVNVLSGSFDRGSGWPRAESSTAYWLAIELFAQEFRAEIASGTLLSTDVITPPNDGNLVAGGQLIGDHTHPLVDSGEELRRRRVLAEARRLALKKLTRRRIAQWAINVVDFRDPDAIQTPFEYDENPWDGWNVVDTQGTNDDASDDLVYPLDGDLSTDENFTQLRLVDASGFFSPGVAIDTSILPQQNTNNFTTLPEDLSLSNQITPGVDADPVPRRVILLDRTRGVVWGAERPEAILTEGLAWHDRRLEDLDIPATGSSQGDGGLVEGAAGEDDDLDQLRKPKGYVYLEALNPWIDGEQRPAEFYSHVDRDGMLVPFDGVRFDRLSNFASDFTDFTQTRSPVWRLACVEEHPLIRNATVSPKTAEALNSLSGVIVDLQHEASDDPPNPETVTSGKSGVNDYLGTELGGEPWVYKPLVVPSPVTAPGFEYGNTKKVTASPLELAYYDWWEERKYEALIGLNTKDGNLDPNAGGRVVRDADNLFVPIGVIERPPRMADPSFPTFDRFAQPGAPAQSSFRISSRVDGSETGLSDPDEPAGETWPVRKVNRAVLLKPTRFIERAFYMAGANSFDANSSGGSTGEPPEGSTNLQDGSTIDRSPRTSPASDLLNPGYRIPELGYDVPLADLRARTPQLRRPDLGVTDTSINVDSVGEPRQGITVRISKFASLDLLEDEHASRLQPITLAPLLPGRRAVIGTAGPVYRLADAGEPSATFAGDDAKRLYRRYTTLISQVAGAKPSEGELLDDGESDGLAAPNAGLRRFEMIQSPNASTHQFAVRMNGFTESQSALLPDGSAFNVTVGAELLPGDPRRPIAPVISVPINHFSISEPLDQYFVRQLELDPLLGRVFDPNPTGQRASDSPAEGSFQNGNGDLLAFDEPFDLLPELVENQTTPNYRAMHLERLANPLMPWNPPPMRVTGDPNTQHDPALPVNPYLPVDSQALDVTAFNSYSTIEADEIDTPSASSEFVHVPSGTVAGRTADDYGPEERHRTKRELPGDRTAIGFSSSERDRPLGPISILWDFQPSRLLWRQSQGATVSELLYGLVYKAASRSGYNVTNGDRVTPASGVLDPNLNPEAQHAANYDLTFEENGLGAGYRPHVVDFPWRMTLGFPSWLSGEFHTGGGLRWFTDAVVDLAAENIDLDSDTITGDILGAAEVNNSPFDSDGDRIPDEYEIAANGRPLNPGAEQDNATTPGFAWPNRPFASAGELLQVPAWGGSRMLSYYSTFNWLHTQMPGFLHDTQINPYNGEAEIRHDGKDYALGILRRPMTFDGDFANDLEDADGNGFDDGILVSMATHPDTDGFLKESPTNALRFRETLGHFGHLLNFFQTARFPAYIQEVVRPVEQLDVNGAVQRRTERYSVPLGAAHFYRVLDYVHVPSRFVATDTLLNPDEFGDARINANDPRAPLAAPFNRVDRYREPGRVNLNTIVGRRDVNEVSRTDSVNGHGPTDASYDPSRSHPRLGDSWSEVYDGLMHRVEDASLLDYNAANPKDSLVEMGHLGPAWRDVVLSRRGYVQSTFDPTIDPSDASFTLAGSVQNQLDYSPRRMHPSFPTFFANPFRAPGEGANVPLAHMVQTGVDATMLRAHPLSPGADGAWGRRGVDDFTVKKDEDADSVANLDGIRDDAGEAGTLTLTIGGGATAGNVGDRLNADVVLSRFDSAGRRGSLPDTFLDNAFKVIPADPNSRELSPGESIAAGIRNSEISKRATPVPLFSGATIEPSLDTERNSTTRYQPIQRIASLATTRSNVYAAWITIGFFEVKPAREDQRIFGRYMTDTNSDGIGDVFTDIGGDGGQANREAFFRTYPEGWTLGQELDLDIGQNQRHRGFYVIDRSRPVAFRPGEDANVAETILLRRRIE